MTQIFETKGFTIVTTKRRVLQVKTCYVFEILSNNPPPNPISKSCFRMGLGLGLGLGILVFYCYLLPLLLLAAGRLDVCGKHRVLTAFLLPNPTTGRN